MGLDIFEILFYYVGKGVWRGMRRSPRSERELSRGFYEVLGFISIALLAMFVFFLLGVFNALG